MDVARCEGGRSMSCGMLYACWFPAMRMISHCVIPLELVGTLVRTQSVNCRIYTGSYMELLTPKTVYQGQLPVSYAVHNLSHIIADDW